MDPAVALRMRRPESCGSSHSSEVPFCNIYMLRLSRPLSLTPVVARHYSSLTPPLVDVRCFHEQLSCHHHEAERNACAAAAAHACREHGLLALPGYGGIPPEVVSSAFSSVKQLFALPEEEKLRTAAVGSKRKRAASPVAEVVDERAEEQAPPTLTELRYTVSIAGGSALMVGKAVH